MRDFLLTEALKRLAAEAATRLSTLVASGDQIPFDVAADNGEESLFYSYVPLTGRYVEEHADELRGLPGFGPAREAVIEAGVAAAYLEARGEVVPADPGARAGRMLIVFFSTLWEGSTGFSLERERLEDALSTLDAESRDADDADVLIVPLVGLRMTEQRLQLPRGVRIVRADSVEAPIEAMRSEGMGRASWEPQYLAIAEQQRGEGAEAALQQLCELVSVMRLFKSGGIGLGPYAFAPTGEECWRRIGTGVPATRPGGYRLDQGEAKGLTEFAAALEARPDPDAALTWAVGRFEMGCERESALEGLSDQLLALRAVLEGHGPVGASLPLRAAALICDEEIDRIEAGERVEQVLQLERALMNGGGVERAIELAVWTEEGARRLLREAALGELGGDLSATADETLVASGLAAGDPQIAISEEEDDFEITATAGDAPGMPGREAEDMPVEEALPSFDRDHDLILSRANEGPVEPSQSSTHEEDAEMEQETRILEPIPAEDEITITATPWLDEVSDPRPGDSLEWPAAGDRDLQHRERIDTPRVRHLFPVPDSDWEIGELEYSRRGRSAG
ncbi:MAG: hypothetical protein R2725_15060 [Solirubrobacterales bacterium]